MSQVALPPGCAAMGVSLKAMKEVYGLSTGPTLFDTLPSKVFDKAFVLDEIQRKGIYSAFHPLRDRIKVRRRPQRLEGLRNVSKVRRVVRSLAYPTALSGAALLPFAPQTYPGSDLLLVADPEARCGENYYLCLTLESRAEQEQVSPDTAPHWLAVLAAAY
jgi:hypothetical protein